MSAPRSSGRWFSDVANVLSTAKSADGFREAEQIARRSATTNSGFDGDSNQSRSEIGRGADPAAGIVNRQSADAPQALLPARFGQAGNALITIVRQHDA